jgi:hypothetical protein
VTRFGYGFSRHQSGRSGTDDQNVRGLYHIMPDPAREPVVQSLCA